MYGEMSAARSLYSTALETLATTPLPRDRRSSLGTAAVQAGQMASESAAAFSGTLGAITGHPHALETPAEKMRGSDVLLGTVADPAGYTPALENLAARSLPRSGSVSLGTEMTTKVRYGEGFGSLGASTARAADLAHTLSLLSRPLASASAGWTDSALPNTFPDGNGAALDGQMTTMLQRRLGAEVADREACQFAVIRIRRSVGFFRQQLQAMTESCSTFDPMMRQLRELAEALEEEVRSAAAGAGALVDLGPLSSSPSLGAIDGSRSSALRGPATSPNRGSYELMRQSLQDAQRRCENLNAELLKQTEVNGELVSSIRAARDETRRLTEQVRQQSEAVAVLSQQRAIAEGRLDDLRKRHRLEEDLREQDAQRRLTSVQEGADARCLELQRQMRATRARVEKVWLDFGRLRAEHVDQKQVAGALLEAMRQVTHQTERRIMQRLEAFMKRQLELQLSSSDTAHDFEVRVLAEHEMRINEVASWSQRHALLAAENDDLKARLIRDVSQLASQLQALERSREEERRKSSEQRAQLHQQAEGFAQRCTELEASNEQLQFGLVRNEAKRVAFEQEHREGIEVIAGLRSQLRDSEEALSTTVSGKDALREQVELLKEQLTAAIDERRRLTDLGDAAVASCRDTYERRLTLSIEEGRIELACMGERLRIAEAELERNRTWGAAAAEDAALLRRDFESAKVEVQDARSVRERLELELERSRQKFHDGQALLLSAVARLEQQHACFEGEAQATVERLEQQRDSFEGEAQIMQVRLFETSREWADREAHQAALAKALEARISDRDALVEEFDRKLSKVSAEVIAHQQRATELQETLNRVSQDATRDRLRLEEERRRLEDAVTNQALTSRENQQQYERWRESHMVSLRETQEVAAVRAALLDKTQHGLCSELDEARRSLAVASERLEETEQDLRAARQMLSESQSNAGLAMQERERGEREVSNLRLQFQEVSSALQTAMRNEVMLTQKLEDASVRYTQERHGYERERDELRTLGDLTVAKQEHCLDRLKVEYESELRSLESSRAVELERERSNSETVAMENEQLRRFLAEQRRNSTLGMSSLQGQLESHILRLQQHTDELRGDLRAASTPPVPLFPVETRYISPPLFPSGRSLAAHASPRMESPRRTCATHRATDLFDRLNQRDSSGFLGYSGSTAGLATGVAGLAVPAFSPPPRWHSSTTPGPVPSAVTDGLFNGIGLVDKDPLSTTGIANAAWAGAN